MKCGRIKEFKDPIIKDQIQNAHSDDFQISHYTLYVYGECLKECGKEI